MKFKKLLSLALAAAMCLSTLPVGALAAEEEPRDTSFFTEQEHTDKKFEDLEYVRPDGEAILAKMEEIRSLLDDKANMEKVSALFDSIGEDFIMFQTMYSLCNIKSYQDVMDEEASGELEVLGDLGSNLSDQLSILLKEILLSPCAPFLEEQLDEESIEYYLAYEPMTEEQLAFTAQETALENEFWAATYNLPTAKLEGVELDADTLFIAYYFGMIDIDEDTYDEYAALLETGDLSAVEIESLELDADTVYYAYAYGIIDYDTYDAYATELARAKNALLGEIYMRMVELRQAEAKSYGYDNYAEYAYEEIFTREYTPEEIRPFHEAVKEYIVPLYWEVRDIYFDDYSDTCTELSGVNYAGDAALDIIEPYLAQMSDELAESFTFMREGGYYDSDYSDTKSSAGFTTSLPAYGAPFFFNAPSGSLYDFTTAVHEFGHYNESYWSSHEFIDYSKNMDLAEVHSQGMELMFSHWYSEIFGEEAADAAEVYLLLNLLDGIVNGCLHDELQQYVYYTPDVTLEQINQEYRRLCGQYGYCEPDDARTEMYSWVDIHHTFTQPCYYISYAVSAAGGFSFWLAAQEGDYFEALDAYLEFVALPGIYTFTESFEQVGLEDPTSPDYIQALADDLAAVIDALDSFDINGVHVNLNGEFLQFPDAQPTIVNDRTMLPIRALVEAMGAQVDWDEAASRVTITLGDTVVTLTIDSNDITVEQGGETTTITMDVAPFIDPESARTYVPVRFVSEAFGLQVGWDETYRTAIIVDAEGIAAALTEGRSYTYLEKLAQFIAQRQEGKDQGIWNMIAQAEGNVTIAGLIDIPVTMDLNAVTEGQSKVDMTMNVTADLAQLLLAMVMMDPNSLPDETTMALLSVLAENGVGMTIRGDMDEGKLYFTLSDEILATVGVEAGTWYMMDMNAAGSDYAALLEGDTAATDGALEDMLSDLKLNSVEEVIMTLSVLESLAEGFADENFLVEDNQYSAVAYLTMNGVDAGIALAMMIEDGTVTAYTIGMGMGTEADGMTVSVDVMFYMDNEDRVSAELNMDVTGVMTMQLTLVGETAEGETAPQTEPPAGATVLDLSDPEVSNGLMGVMPLDDAA